MKSHSCSISFRAAQATAAALLAASCVTTALAESKESKAPAARAPSQAAARSSSPATPPPKAKSPATPSKAKQPATPRYTSPHWQLDSKYQHDRYYPRRGYVVGTLPPGHVGITHGGVRYFHHAGVWFRARGPRYVVVAPPLGIVIPLLPFGYSTVWLGREPYYYADEVYYIRVPGGFRVVAPPPADKIVVEEPQQPLIAGVSTPVTVPASPPVAPPASAAPPPPAPQPAPSPKVVPTPSYQQPSNAAPIESLIIYPKSNQTSTQITFDRIECDRWAIGQTGYEPSQPAVNPGRRADFMRAAAACLEGRGYNVK
ncbi:MAG: hypothetical protein IPP88_17630 [Betaproteobacteria bacterium]|nr:hypothetical protein [Betaproteobacteria bacterium]